MVNALVRVLSPRRVSKAVQYRCDGRDFCGGGDGSDVYSLYKYCLHRNHKSLGFSLDNGHRVDEVYARFGIDMII